jgi:hypothetical protein
MSMGKRPMTDEEKAARPKSGKGSKSELVEDGPGEAFYNYVEEKKLERKLGRPLNDEASARPLTWGKLVERVAFLALGFTYQLTSKSTLVHPTLNCWVGTPDGESQTSVLEIKCPYTIKSYCDLHDCNTIDEVREKHKDGEKFYWQCISNAILTNKKTADLVFYMPYKSELDNVRSACEEWEGHPNQVAWIHFGADEDLPHLIDGMAYKNVHKITFEVSEQDKKRLTQRVELAARLLK